MSFSEVRFVEWCEDNVDKAKVVDFCQQRSCDASGYSDKVTFYLNNMPTIDGVVLLGRYLSFYNN